MVASANIVSDEFETVESEQLRMELPYNLAPDEVEYFVQAVKTDEHSGGVDKVVESIQSGKKQLWVWRDGESIGVWITGFSYQPDGESEMVLLMLAGTNLIQIFLTVEHLMVDKAREAGCKRLVAFVKPLILEKLKDAFVERGVEVDFDETYVVISKET
ncbi:MAG: hypothetical protein CL489_16660 [Acidobacteria bacterium]|nr:hypothetical protein [Acidobacteriota bacterium]|tara:strand:- start:219 stop:695 length:477 start_codon:yes stop_codon:yes gene_type:complete